MSAPMPLTAFTYWLASGERGLSSEAIVSHLTGHQVGRYACGEPHHPHDPSDFRRCERLLDAVPLARLMFPAMRTASPVWARLVDAWDELVALLREEEQSGTAPKLYARMKEIIYADAAVSS